jgi:serine/threonine-protein kinase
MPDRIIKGKQGRYKLIDVRGSGSMATVYVSRDLDSNRIFAVKVLRPEVANQVELLDRFHREAQILMMLTDPHIVRPVEYGDDGDTHYIVMDYVDGSTLKEQIVSSGVFTVDRALDVMLQAAEGLHAAHERQVIHRDVKPQNILVTTKNVVKLTDFGMARAQESVTLTKSGVFMGTPYYVSPEQADNSRGADIRSDLYSLACVFFELLTGHVPYEGSNAVDVVVKHVRLPVPSVCERRSELPAAFDEFFSEGNGKGACQPLPDTERLYPRSGAVEASDGTGSEQRASRQPLHRGNGSCAARTAPAPAAALADSLAFAAKAAAYSGGKRADDRYDWPPSHYWAERPNSADFSRSGPFHAGCRPHGIASAGAYCAARWPFLCGRFKGVKRNATQWCGPATK